MSTIEYPRPKNFPYSNVFFDANGIALMYGVYKDKNSRSLGMRWNIGESVLGYPSTHGKPTWLVVPDKIALYILRGIRDDSAKNQLVTDEFEFQSAINDLEQKSVGNKS